MQRCYFCALPIRDEEKAIEVGLGKHVHALLCFDQYREYLKEVVRKMTGQTRGEVQ